MTPLIALIPSLGWGINNIFINKYSRKIEPLVVGFGVQAIGLVINALLFLFFPSFTFPAHTWGLLLITGVMSALLFWLACYILSIESASLAVTIMSTWTIVAAILGFIFKGDAFSGLKLVSLVFVGMGVIFLSLDISSLKRAKLKLVSAGVGYALIFVFGVGIYAYLFSSVVGEMGWLGSSFGIRALTVLTLVVVLAMRGKFSGAVSQVSKFPFLGVMGLIDVIAYTTFSLSLLFFRLSFVSVLVALTPLVTLILARIFLKEKLTPVHSVGALSTILGIILFQI